MASNYEIMKERRDWWIKELARIKPCSKAAIIAAKFIHRYDIELGTIGSEFTP